MNRAFRIARRYAEGGSDDAPPLLGWGVNPVKNLVEHRPVLQMDPLTGPRSGAVPTRTEPEPAPPAQSRQDLARSVAGELVNQYGDNHQAISERMLKLDPQDHNDVMGHLPQSVQNGIIDHRLQEANRVLNPPQQPAAESKTNFWDEYRAAQDRSDRATPINLGNKPPNKLTAWLTNATPEHVRNLHDDDLDELISYFDNNQMFANRFRQLHKAADAEDSIRAAAQEAGESAERIRNADLPPRQPGASRTGYVSPYGIYGRAPQLTDEEYEALQNPEQLSKDEGNVATFPGSDLPGVPKQNHPFDYMNSVAWTTYNKLLRPKFGDIYKFAKEYFAGYDPSAIKVDSGEMYGYGPGSLNFEGQLHDKGNHVAEFDASIIPGSKGAHLGYFEIDPLYRGVAGPALLRNQIDAYKKMGLKFVDLLAAAPTYTPIFGGSYAWAKYGFTPTQKDWDMIRQTALKKLDSGELAPVNPEDKEVARNILNTFGPRAIWPLSDMKSPTASGMPYGKAVLLQGPSWHGELTFKDPGAMRRFDAYISRPKKPTKAD